MARDDSLSGKLILAARLCRSFRATMLLEEGIYAGQDALLKSLAEHDGQSMGSLAANLGVQPPTVTKMVNRMATQGLIRRQTSQTDSRQFNVFLTQAGSALIDRIDDMWVSTEATVFADLKEKDGKRLNKILDKIIERVEHGTPRSPGKQKQ